jgi:hypothetical protein
MSQANEFRKLVTQGLPILLIILYLLFPQSFVQISEHPLGKLIAILIITLYTYQNMMYGFIVCLLVILFYHKEVEGFISPSTQNYADFIPKASEKEHSEIFEGYLEKDFTHVEEAYQDNLPPIKKVGEFLFRRDVCDASLNCVKYKDQKVKNHLVTHVYPELQFREGECNPCDRTCHFNIHRKNETQSLLQSSSSKETSLMTMVKSMYETKPEPFVVNKKDVVSSFQ